MAVTSEATVEIPRSILEELITGVREHPTNEARNAADAAELILEDAFTPKPCDSSIEFGGYIHSCNQPQGPDHDELRHGSSTGLTWTTEEERTIESEPKTTAEPGIPVTLDQLKEWYESAQRKRKMAADSISTFVAFARFYEEHRAILEPVLKGMGPSKEVPLKHLKYWVDRLERGSSVQDLIGKFIKD